MPIEYDPTVLQQLADKLYSQARFALILWTLLGLGIGIAGGLGVPTDRALGAAIFGLLGGIFGFLVGRGQAFRLRVQAQGALCQRQIELNTRRA